jgi:hypothetical protein
MIYVVVDCDCRIRCRPSSLICPRSLKYYFSASDNCMGERGLIIPITPPTGPKNAALGRIRVAVACSAHAKEYKTAINTFIGTTNTTVVARVTTYKSGIWHDLNQHIYPIPSKSADIPQPTQCLHQLTPSGQRESCPSSSPHPQTAQKVGIRAL